MDPRILRRTARLTQLELSRVTRIDRAKLSLAECGYVELTRDEQAAVKRAIAEEKHTARVREALAAASDLRQKERQR